MDPVTGMVALKAIQGVTDAVTTTETTQSTSQDGDFDALLKSMLTPDAANNINEEELFASLLHERISTTKGAEAAEQFKSIFESKKQALTRPDGVVLVEDAANEALSAMVEQGALSAEEADKLYSDAFQAAQLDDNHTALYDSRGSATDPTIAVMELEAALLHARSIIEQIESGADLSTDNPDGTESSPDVALVPGEEVGSTETGDVGASEEIVPDGTSVDGEKRGFVFKPESDKGPLVVLLPATMADQVMNVVLKDSNGNEIEQGVSSGYANPDDIGEREHFRFSRPGGEYPQDLVVEVTLQDGSTKQYHIPDPSLRYD
ncbi:MAG: hypothetical protein KDD42_09290 [Bdellovibrionales bacterium]|nr:hypothetical protein [Bdellovibrionales bacterium]